MNYFYDVENQCFLVEGIHSIPKDAISVRESEYQFLVDGRAKGREIILFNNNLTLSNVRPSDCYDLINNQWVLNKEKLSQKLILERDKIRQAINTKRDQTDASGVFVPQLGKWVDSNDKAYQNILGVKASLDLLGDMEIEWTWADNTSSTINRQTLAVIVGALLQAKQANHANAIKHKEAVMLVDNPLEYDYSTGWIKTYIDYVAEVSNE